MRNRDRYSNSGYPAGGESYSGERDPYGRRYDSPASGEQARRDTEHNFSRPTSWRNDPQWQGQGVGKGDYPGRSGLTFPYQSAPQAPAYPKGYVRPDAYIEDDLCERLSRSGLEVGEVSVAVSGGNVVLTGNVPSRWIKHAVEDAASQTRGATYVDNQIRVGPAAPSAGGEQAQGRRA